MDKIVKQKVIKISAIVMIAYAIISFVRAGMSAMGFLNGNSEAGWLFSNLTETEKIAILLPIIADGVISWVSIICGIVSLKKKSFNLVIVPALLYAVGANGVSLISSGMMMNAYGGAHYLVNINVFHIIIGVAAIVVKVCINDKKAEESEQVKDVANIAESVTVATESTEEVKPVVDVKPTTNNVVKKDKKGCSGRAKAFRKLALICGFVFALGLILFILGLVMTAEDLTLMYIGIGVMLLAIGYFVSQIFPILNSFCDKCGTNFNYDTDISWEVRQVTVDGLNKYADVHIVTRCPNCGTVATFNKKLKVEYYNKEKGYWVQNNIYSMVRRYFWKIK